MSAPATEEELAHYSEIMEMLQIPKEMVRYDARSKAEYDGRE